MSSQHFPIGGSQHSNRENNREINELWSLAAGGPGLSLWLPRIPGKSDAFRRCPDVNGGALLGLLVDQQAQSSCSTIRTAAGTAIGAYEATVLLQRTSRVKVTLGSLRRP